MPRAAVSARGLLGEADVLHAVMVRFRRPIALAIWCSLVATTTVAHAQTRELRWDPPADATVTIVGSALWLASVALWPRLAPSSCRWCDDNGMDSRVRGALVWHDPAIADALSDGTAFLLAPAAALGLDALAASHEQARSGIPLDALLITEATVLALDVTQITKLLAARERPYVHFLPEGERHHTADDDVSFFSGHTAETFALASATGTVATLRGYRWAPIPWIAGGVIAAGTGYLRIGADRHWLTDVLIGLVAGVCVGIAVPLLFHSPSGG